MLNTAQNIKTWNRWLISAGFCALFIATPCRADLPLTIEDLLSEKNQFRLELGVSYANADRRNVNARFGLLQTSTDSFVLLPLEVNNQRQNSDTLALIAGLRYGIGARTELYSRLTATADEVRIQNGAETDRQSSQQWNDVVLGVNHQLSADNNTPALLAFAEVSALENTATNSTDLVYGKTAQVGFTSYRSIDPVVLSLTAGYRYAGSRTINGQRVDPGDLLFINPSLGFAINNEVTVTGGVQLRFRGKDEVDGSTVGIRTSQTDLDFGLGYAASERLTLNVTIRADISGDGGAQAGFNLLYKL